MIPAPSLAAYRAAHDSAAWIDRSPQRGRILVSGPDRASWLQGLLTNDIAALRPGTGCYAAYLTPQGRMIADAFVYELGDALLLVVEDGVQDAVVKRFGRSIFAEGVQVSDVSASRAQIGVIGPMAAAAVAQEVRGVGRDALDAMAEFANVRAELDGRPALVARTADAGLSGFDLFVDADAVAGLRAALAAAGVAALDETAAETIRIEGGVPRFRRDMKEDTIPLEAGIEARAISFTKGCYVGQEVIVRVLHRGHGRVARRLVGLVLDAGAAVPATGAAIRSGERDAGSVTSAAWSPALERPIALGYVHRDFIAPGTRVSVAGSDATVSALPFAAPTTAAPGDGGR